MPSRDAKDTALDLLSEALPFLNPERERDPAAARALFVKVRAFLQRDALATNPSRIRITKSSQPGYWYADLVGQEFDVSEAREGFFVVVNPQGWGGWSYSVSADDCEPVDDLPKAAERG